MPVHHAIKTDPAQIAGAQAAQLCDLLTQGGDARVRPDSAGRNKYYATIAPSDALALGSSTISSISHHAFDILLRRWRHQLFAPLSNGDYREALEILRFKLRGQYGLSDTEIVFAASGTDLEYVGLAVRRDDRPITSILLGRDEVGSGCVHSAAGRFFAAQTATGDPVTPGAPIDPIFADLLLRDVAVRDSGGMPRRSNDVMAELIAMVEEAVQAGRRAVVHVVHGLKSGLVLPGFDDVATLADRFGGDISIVVDACQLRIAPDMARRYLALGCIILMTGSKFAGGPPFSGFALIPAARGHYTRPLPAGFAAISRQAEWPADWPGTERLCDRANFGLLLRLQAAMIEIERFMAIDPERVEAISARFTAHVTHLAARMGVGLVRAQQLGGDAASCLAMSTLHCLDLSQRWPACDLEQAREVHRAIYLQSERLHGREIRLGQPVSTHILPDGRAAGAIRLSLSMPMIAELALLSDIALDARLEQDMAAVETAFLAVFQGVESDSLA